MRKLYKKGIKFDQMLIGFLVLTLFIIGGTMMMVDMNESYADENISISTEEYGNVYNATNEMFGIAEDADDKMFEGDISDTDSWESMTKGSYSSVRLVKGSYSLFKAITTDVASQLGIHPTIVRIAYIAFVLMIVFSVIYMVFRFIPR